MRSLAGVFVACFLLACTTRAGAATPWAQLADPVLVGVEPAGLSHPRVDSLAQDSAGFLWIGTQTGLARFDGYRAQLFTADPSNETALPESDIRTLLSDPRGALWIGTSASGLVRFDEATETFKTWRANPNAETGPRSANVVAMAIAKDGRLWIGGDAGLDLFDPQTQRFSAIELVAHQRLQPRVEAVRVDSRGAVWVATLRGLYYRQAHAQQFRLFEPHDSETPQRSFFSICEDHTGRIWVGALDYVLVLDAKQRLVETIRSSRDQGSLAHGEQWALAEPLPGTMWAGSNNGEVSIIDTNTGKVRRIAANAVTSKGRSGGSVWQFLKDRFGLLWIGDGFGGLSFYNTRTRGIYNLALAEPKLGGTTQGAIALTATRNDTLWVGGNRDSLIELDPRRGAVRTGSTTNGLPVNALWAESNDTLWIGTDAGLCKLDAADAMLCPSQPLGAFRRVSALAQTAYGLWIGTGAGLFVRHADGTIESYRQGIGPHALTNDDMYVVYPDRKANVWVGEVNGLDRVDPKSHTVVHYVHDFNDQNSLGLGEIISILEDRQGRIWAAGPGGPINVMTIRNGHAQFAIVRDENGRPLQDATAVAQDARGRVWAALSNGIAVIDPATLRGRKLGPADGVPDEDYEVGVAATAADGTIFFGRQNGVTVISSDAYGPGAAANRVAPLVITSSKIAERDRPPWPLNQGETILVPAERRDFSVGFAALDFARSTGLRYEYRLSGYDRSWLEADPAYRLATYTNLSPGTYTLDIRAIDPGTGFSLSQIAIPLVVEARWYETWWFRALLALVIAIALYAAYRVTTAVFRQRQRQLEAIVADRTHALRQANEKLEEMSVTDALTGLHNRRYLESHIEADIAMSLRRYEDANREGSAVPNDADLIFFVLDVDHFKSINDRYGHRSGDLVLTQMRERLSEVFRESDFIIRWGGDEFLAVARATNRREGSDIAERICRVMNERPFALEGGVPYELAGSVGFAAFPFVTAQPRTIGWRHVVDLADQALYIAKESGRANWIGLAATGATNPSELVQRLSTSVVGPVDTGELRIISRASVSSI